MYCNPPSGWARVGMTCVFLSFSGCLIVSESLSLSIKDKTKTEKSFRAFRRSRLRTDGSCFVSQFLMRMNLLVEKIK